ASIGLGQFMHLIRRNVDCTYIIEDNGTYGLTKGQFSATADLGSMQKKGSVNTFQPIDPCAVALALGCSFVARSFSGDGKQVVPLIKAAIAHRGTAVLDIVSPCVTFNDHDGSTKSYSWVKDHEESLAEKDLRLAREQFDQFLAEFACAQPLRRSPSRPSWQGGRAWWRAATPRWASSSSESASSTCANRTTTRSQRWCARSCTSSWRA